MVCNNDSVDLQWGYAQLNIFLLVLCRVTQLISVTVAQFWVESPR